MHRAGLLGTIIAAAMLAVGGCGGCRDDAAKTDPQNVEPAAEPTVPVDKPAEPSGEKKAKKPPQPTKAKKPPLPPKETEVDKAVAQLKLLGATVDRPKRADGSFEPVRGVFLANNNRHAREAVKYVAKLPTIRTLHLSGAAISDADLFYLHGLVNLSHLKLKGTRVTSAGLAYLQDKTKLEYLNLINTKVDDSGMKFLYGLKNLRTLSLGGTKVSRQAAEELKKRLPKLTIK